MLSPPLDARIPRLTRLGGSGLRHALMAGSRRVIRSREEINKINVFPVPDGDTGTNLAYTFGAVLSGLARLRNAGAGAVMQVAASEAIDGARGNSGAILAQFFQGLAESTAQRKRLSLRDLADAVAHAATQSRMALAEPKEGTILSVISEFALALKRDLVKHTNDLRGLFQSALRDARSALARTPLQLRVLAQAGVVDAGGQGFVDFLEGVEEFICHRHQQGRVRVDSDSTEISHSHGESSVDMGSYRYCTECLVDGVGMDIMHVRETLAALPLNSLVVAGSGTRMRVHAHIAAPAMLFESLNEFGKVNARKADDMWAQARAMRAKAKVAIVVDTGADLPAAEVERLNLHTVPVRVNFGAEEFLDHITLQPAELYARMRASQVPARTSQPPAGEFRRLFDILHSHASEIICVNVSSRLSGTYQAALSAAKMVDAKRVHVFDSRTAAAGEALLALYAGECALAGLDASSIIQKLQQIRPLTRTFAVIRDLSFGVRGGRVPRWVLPLSRLLGVSVVVADNAEGKLQSVYALRSRADLSAKFANHITRRLDQKKTYRLIVGHCDAQLEGERLAAALRERIANIESLHFLEAGTAIGAHAGPGSLVVGVQEALSAC
jgi:uncharacterized protein